MAEEAKAAPVAEKKSTPSPVPKAEPQCLCYPTDVLHGKYHPKCPVHNYDRGPTMTMGHESADQSTHIERLNDTESHNPADIPGLT